MNIEKIRNKVRLINYPNLTFFFLGVGSAFTKRFYQTNVLVFKEDSHLLIDCGTKCPQALETAGIQVTDIKNFYVTHAHSDHSGGLEQVFLLDRYVTRQKPSLYIPEPYADMLFEHSLKGGLAFNEFHNGEFLKFDDFANLRYMKPITDFGRDAYEINAGAFHLTAIRNRHVPDSVPSWKESGWSTSLIIDKRIFYSGDTRFEPELLEKADKMYNLEAIFYDCQFNGGAVHASLDELKTLPASLKEKMILVHYGDDFEKYEKEIQNSGFHSLAKEQVFYSF